MLKINFCSAPCGSGKTYQLVKSACQLANDGETVLFLQPTKELIDKTIEGQLASLFCPPSFAKFYGGPAGHSVARQLTEYLKKAMDGGHIVFATHQVMPFVRFWPNQTRLRVLIDEELQVVKHGYFRIPHTHELITRYIDLASHDAIYSRVIVNDPIDLAQIAKNPASDEIYERFRETAQTLTNEHWGSFVNTEQFENLRAGKVKQLSIHSVLNPRILDGFASVTIASANFRDTLLYRIWSKEGVQFEEDNTLSQNLRFQEHRNGHLVSVKYLTDRVWSKKLQGTPCQTDGQSVLTAMVQGIKDEFQDNRFLWQANKWISDAVFGSNGQRLPNVPHGLNDYSGYDRIAFLSALNPRSDHFRFLETRGVDPGAIRLAIYCSSVYQSVLRTSIRDPQSITQKTVIVPDLSAARYLEAVFRGSQVEKLKTELIDLENATKRGGRPRKHSSSKDRQREYRLRKKEFALKTGLSLESFPYVERKSCCDEKGISIIRYEKGIGINSYFVTHHAWHGTLYRDKRSNMPLGYLSGGNSELFLRLLEHLHTRTVPSKEASFLISPAIFDPNLKTEESTKRGIGNIVAMRHLWMDFEGGELKPEQLPELFPHIRLAVFNTYNHSGEAPRFRVVIPFDELISAEDYGVLYNNLIAKIEDAGYSVGKSKGGMRSGLDVSKRIPTSSFYLPCQAMEPSETFFQDYNDDKRKLLDPMKWIENTVIHFPQSATQTAPPAEPRKVDLAAVANATKLWRQSRKYPGEGNDRFFNFAVSLRSAGMSPKDIELKLRDEATFGRSAHERRAQITSIMSTLKRSLKKSA